MNFKYYQSPSDKEGLFAISNGNKFFIINTKLSYFVMEIDNISKSRLKEIEQYEYMFSKEKINYLIKKIKLYISIVDMEYRRKMFIKLLEDIEELNQLKEGEYIED